MKESVEFSPSALSVLGEKMLKLTPALIQQWEQTGKIEDYRYMCENCGGFGKGFYNCKTGGYDPGICESCKGEGYLGFMFQNNK